MSEPVDAVMAIHNAFRRDIERIDAAALDAARGVADRNATIERFGFMSEVLEWHAHGEDLAIRPIVEAIAPGVYDAYGDDHRGLDAAADVLRLAIASGDPLATARATSAFRSRLELHLDREDRFLYRLVREHVSIPDQQQAVGAMASTAPKDRFPDVVAWMFPLIDHDDRVLMTRSWQMGMPPEGFAMAAHLIERAVGEDWAELTVRVPELVGGAA